LSNLKESPNSGKNNIPSAKNMQFGIVVSQWNSSITKALLKGALAALKKHGVPDNNIIVKHVPGSFELPFGSQLIQETQQTDAIICLGCVIQGETPHFDYICNAVSEGIMNLNLKYSKPFIFGVLTCTNRQQAIDRSGGIMGNKGEEAALTAISMVALKQELSQKK
jgi:6,7-dimethyl-8-ribityllumazine synthase